MGPFSSGTLTRFYPMATQYAVSQARASGYNTLGIDAQGRTIMSEGTNQPPEQPADHQDPELRALYAKYRQEFSAADLQKYTEIEPGIPAEEVLAEMEEIHRKVTGKEP
jgi:hypothetical protein